MGTDDPNRTSSSYGFPGLRGTRAVPGPGQRLWRLRRLHRQIDAQICDRGDRGVELQFFFNGELVYTRRWESRDGAVAEAAEKRKELERGGWTAHW